MSSLKTLKKVYDRLGNDHIRRFMLTTAERLGIRKDIIRMDTNSFCNIRCIMCNQMSTCKKKKFMSLDEYKKIIDNLGATARMLYLSCAYEPLITPDFTDYLKYAKEKGIPHVSFCTNALLLDSKIISHLVEYEVDEIIISFNGFCEADYNRIMMGSNFNHVSANIKALSDYKEKHQSIIPHIRLNSILLKSNLLNFEDMFQFLSENDIDTVQFRELMLYEDQNNPNEVKNELLSNLSKKEHEQVSIEIKEMAKKLKYLGKEVILPAAFWNQAEAKPPDNSIFPICPQADDCSSVSLKTDIVLHKKLNSQKQSCSIPCFSYWINCAGEVRVCGYDNKGIIGNALYEDYELLQLRRTAFRKLALAGECNRELCTINVDTSIIV